MLEQEEKKIDHNFEIFSCVVDTVQRIVSTVRLQKLAYEFVVLSHISDLLQQI